MSEIKARTFGHTAAALIVFDSTAAPRARAWETAETQADVDAAETADINALLPVLKAFHRDTRDINSVESCMRMDLASLRRLARGSAPATTVPDVSSATTPPSESDDDSDTDGPAPR